MTKVNTPLAGGNQQNQERNIESMLQENLELSREIYRLTQKSNRYILFAQIFTVVKIILIIGPIILAIIYLPPFFKEALGTYRDLYGNGTGDSIINSGELLNKYIK